MFCGISSEVSNQQMKASRKNLGAFFMSTFRINDNKRSSYARRL
ncbi:hypothetical protein ACKRLN_04815 [Anaerococcus sp. DFU013_CI05]